MKDKGKEFDSRLPRVPTLTDEQLAKNDENQAIWKKEAKGPTYTRALAVIAECESIPLKDMVPIQRANYAQALADVGKFKEAARVTQESERKNNYKAIDKAVWRDDEDRCKCTNFKTFDEKKQEVEHDRHFVVREIWSEKHGMKMGLFKCNHCGDLNVR